MAERGYFSLIQFVPDRGRAEGANVGVVVICPKLGAIRVLMSSGNESPKQRFGNHVVDEWRLDAAKAALQHRLNSDLADQPSLDALEHVRKLEGNALTMTIPTTVAVDDIGRVASKLLEELVELPKQRRERTKGPDVDAVLRKLRTQKALIREPRVVTLPKGGGELKVAFAYQNGALNYVHSHGFSASKDKTLESATRLGGQGQLLFKGTARKERLIVLARFENEDHKSTVSDICGELDVRLVDEEEADAFVEEIVQTAHA